MNTPGEGGRYLRDPDTGELTLVERLNWTPDDAKDAPAAEIFDTSDVKEYENVLSKEVLAGKN